ncbi:MAG: TerC family protein [Verrucomicrobia bacterium]|nr:TerC family protein [Verrucomicrobiota bacterium]
MEWLTDPDAWIGLLTLTVLELVLGIDNLVFISILSEKLPSSQQKMARTIGLSLAMLMRILLLLSLSWVMDLTRPLFSVGVFDLTGRMLILVTGGLFLLVKSTHEIHKSIGAAEAGGAAAASLLAVVAQIIVLDAVFSLDSVITAVGMVDEIEVMIIAVILAMLVMIIFAGTVSSFVQRYPTLKMLALSFLLLVGVNLIAEGVGFHIPKGYTYFAMAFSVFVEILNLNADRRKPKPGSN